LREPEAGRQIRWSAADRPGSVDGSDGWQPLKARQLRQALALGDIHCRATERERWKRCVRGNMPFGAVGKGEFGTYFIGYARSPHRIERMLVNMFVGNPPGNCGPSSGFHRAMTRTLFSVASASYLTT
jgi:hypothetical protein